MRFLHARAARLCLLLAPAVLAAQPLLNVPTRFVVLSPTTPLTMYASVGNGLFRSSGTFDLGFNWATLHLRPAGQAQPALNQILIDPGDPRTVYYVTDAEDGGVWRSIDSGATWQTANAGLPARGGALFCRLRGQTPRTVYCSAGGALYQTLDGAVTWTRLLAFPTEMQTVLFAIDPRNSNVIAYAERNLIRYTSNLGQSWRDALPALSVANGAITDLLIDPNDHDTASQTSLYIYVSVAAQTGAGVYRSNNSAISFTLLQGTSGFQAASLFLHPSGVLYATSATRASYRLFPRPRADAASAEVLIHDGAGPTYLTSDPLLPERLFAATARGILKISDDFRRWEQLTGTIRPTLAQPDRAYEFALSPNQQGALELPVRLSEGAAWTVPVTLTTSGEPWLQVTNPPPATGNNATVRVQAGQLAPGDYEASVLIRSQQTSNPEIRVPVRLTMRAAPPDPGYRVSNFAGIGAVGTFGDEGQATRAALNSPDSLARLADGTILFSDSGNHAVRAIAPNGVIRRLAGRYQPGFAGDQGDPLLASLRTPRGLAVSPDNRVHIVDADNARLRVIAGGVIDTVTGLTANGRGIAISRSGRTAIALPTLHIVVEPTGPNRLTLLAGTGAAGFRGDGGPAAFARLSSPTDVWFDEADNLYIADTDNHRIRVIDASTRAIRTVAGSGLAGFQGDTGRALEVALNRPTAVATNAAGEIFIIDSGNNRIRAVSPDGTLRTIAGDGNAGASGDDGPAIAARFSSPTDILPLPDGTLLVTDTANHRIRLLRPTGAGRPVISPGGVTGAADGRTAVSPGGLFSIYGLNLSPATATAGEIPWPESLENVSVAVNGRPAPLYFVSPNQINAQLPFEIPPGPADVTVTADGVPSEAARITVREAAPGVFAAVNEDGTLNSQQSPARVGRPVVVYMTGQGTLDNPIATGQAAQAEPLSRAVLPSSARIGGAAANLLFLGMTPGFVGLAQANVIVPQLFSGDHALEITVNGVASNPFRIWVTQ